MSGEKWWLPPTTCRRLLWTCCWLLACCSIRASALHSSSPTTRRQNGFAYTNYWDHLLLEEHREAVEALRERRKTWSRQRLEASGSSIFHAIAEPDSELFGEKIVRIYKPGETRLQDRFTRGDVLVMTPEESNWMGRKSGGGDVMAPRECLVVDVGEDWMTAGVGPSWPRGLYEARKLPGAYRVRLDRTAPRAPLNAQRCALNQLSQARAGEIAALLADLFVKAPGAAEEAANLPTRFASCEDALPMQIHTALQQAMLKTSFVPNGSQQDSISWALQRRISLIRGPPGTGKTSVAALLIATAVNLLPQPSQEESVSSARVLAVAHSNGAADVLVEALLRMGVPAVRMGRPASVSTSVQHRTVAAIAAKMPQVLDLKRAAMDSTIDRHERSTAVVELKTCMLDMQQLILKAAPVVVASCIGAQQLYEADDASVAFPLVVLDEAAQSTEPALVCALAAARAEQLVLVGDTQQLPPTILSESSQLRMTLGVSPMARLENAGVDQTTLRVQYRMPESLLEHPSKYFYDGQVGTAKDREVDDLPTGFRWPNGIPLAFVEVGMDSEVAHNFGGRSNPIEAELVVKIVDNLLEPGDTDAKDVAVISPYAKQVQYIRTLLSRPGRKKSNAVRVGTVDSFQGQETGVVIFSTVRSNELNELGFLRDKRRLCVAITRARRGLVIVGDSKVLKTCRHWAALLNSCKQRGCCLDAATLDVTQPAINDETFQDDRETIVEEALKDLLGGGADDDEFDSLFAPVPID